MLFTQTILSKNLPVFGKNEAKEGIVVRSVKSSPQGNFKPKMEALSPDSVRDYILGEAEKVGVDKNIVSWIVYRESQWGKRMVGDDGISLGVWQINVVANPQISRACAMDLKCSTRVSLGWLKQGLQNKWSTWKYRCTWFKKENPPDCKK